ncbi:uncharacterized protein LOC116853475 [Odontomachus brunneus]|uniref:uncharacterized protein LOC116853475 n=1 Tax=Odontomachus brunneus TaxID=486640 RepID=UPI0013F29E49|nr:uncharacterized protein LOC116853475 [Odontomachus brunneus]
MRRLLLRRNLFSRMETEEWVEVTAKGRKRTMKKLDQLSASQTIKTPEMVQADATAPYKTGNGNSRPTPTPAPRRRRIPHTAAVTITGKEATFSYTEDLRAARQSVSLADLGIEGTRVRKTANGEYVIEIPGPDREKQASALAARLKEVMPTGTMVNTPLKLGEVKVWGFDDSLTGAEIVDALAQEGECRREEIRAGPIRLSRNGFGSIWIRCPLEAAIRMTDKGRQAIGWNYENGTSWGRYSSSAAGALGT